MFPIYIVENFDSSGEVKKQKYGIKDFYRSKDSPAEYEIGKYPQLLKLADTSYYLDIYWSIEPNCMPFLI